MDNDETGNDHEDLGIADTVDVVDDNQDDGDDDGDDSEGEEVRKSGVNIVIQIV